KKQRDEEQNRLSPLLSAADHPLPGFPKLHNKLPPYLSLPFSGSSSCTYFQPWEPGRSEADRPLPSSPPEPEAVHCWFDNPYSPKPLFHIFQRSLFPRRPRRFPYNPPAYPGESV